MFSVLIISMIEKKVLELLLIVYFFFWGVLYYLLFLFISVSFIIGFFGFLGSYK